MSHFLRGLASLHRLKAERLAARPEPQSQDLADDPEAHLTFRAGDVVVDPITGQEGTVEHVTYRHVQIPPPRG